MCLTLDCLRPPPFFLSASPSSLFLCVSSPPYLTARLHLPTLCLSTQRWYLFPLFCLGCLPLSPATVFRHPLNSLPPTLLHFHPRIFDGNLRLPVCLPFVSMHHCPFQFLIFLFSSSAFLPACLSSYSPLSCFLAASTSPFLSTCRSLFPIPFPACRLSALPVDTSVSLPLLPACLLLACQHALPV